MMPNFKKGLLFLAIVLCFYILYQLINRRNTLLQKPENFETMPTIQNTFHFSLPLKEYLIFSSWNACVDTNMNVTLQQLENVMQSGCRFLDFEIYNIDGNPKIGYSSSIFEKTAAAQYLESDTLDFYDVCNKILTAGSPNPNDPLFLHFRIKSSHPKILDKMADVLVATGISGKLYNDLTIDTMMSELKNRIIILVDKSYVSDIPESTSFQKLITLYTNTPDFPSSKMQGKLESTFLKEVLAVTSDDDTTNVTTIQMVTPGLGGQHQSSNIGQADFKKLVVNHKMQIIPYKFYSKDDGLAQYKSFFSNNGKKAFISMAVAYRSLEHT